MFSLSLYQKKQKEQDNFYFYQKNLIKSESMSQQIKKITYIILNGINYLPWVHIVTIGLGDRFKLEYVTGK
jgi:hypothetical protein